MTENGKFKGFNDILSSVLREDFTGNVGGIAAHAKKKDKYFPPTIEASPALKYQTTSIPMGQDEVETDAPPNMIYPFDSMFSGLVDQYVKCMEVAELLKSSIRLPTLTPAKRTIVEDSHKSMLKITQELKSVIAGIEQLSI